LKGKQWEMWEMRMWAGNGAVNICSGGVNCKCIIECGVEKRGRTENWWDE
jgi:hypothetical protein